MEVCRILDELLTYPLSSVEVRRLVTVIKLNRARWSGDMESFTPLKRFELPPQDIYTQQGKMFLEDDTRWVEYADQVATRQTSEDDEMSSSLQRMVQGQSLDTLVVEKYLQLLRDDRPRFPIADIQELDVENVVELINGMRERPIILPFYDGEHWLFAALYPDTIHWYDSRPGAGNPTEGAIQNPAVEDSTTTAIKSNFRSSTGPKHNEPRDSALFMLLGIRLIANTHAHLSQQEAEMVIPRFRSRMLVEISTLSLCPSREKFDELLSREQERHDREYLEQSFHFLDALGPLSNELVGRQQSLRPPEDILLLQNAITRPHTILDDRRTVLMTLSEAVASIRSITASESTDLAVLWSSLNDGAHISEFHRRYNGILFCEKLEQYQEIDALSLEMHHNIARSSFRDVQAMQARYQHWRDLCSLHSERGPAKYTLLCIIPKGQLVDRQQITKISARLANPADPLADQLEKATDLCKAIIQCRLPRDRLLIESYKSKAHEPLTPEMYNAFLSLDSHPRVPIPRMAPLDYQRQRGRNTS